MANQETRLFTISLWQVHQTEGPREMTWRGKLQSLPDGEAYYFRDWEVLIEHLEKMLAVRGEPLDPQEVEP